MNFTTSTAKIARFARTLNEVPQITFGTITTPTNLVPAGSTRSPRPSPTAGSSPRTASGSSEDGREAKPLRLHQRRGDSPLPRRGLPDADWLAALVRLPVGHAMKGRDAFCGCPIDGGVTLHGFDGRCPGEQPQPSAEDQCEAEGHVYNGDEADRGRCYCGFASFPLGGPAPCFDRRTEAIEYRDSMDAEGISWRFRP